MRRLPLVAFALCVACASAGGGGEALPSWPEWVAAHGAPATGQGRVVVYGAIRDEALEWMPQVLLDGTPLGRSREFTFLVADRPPGPHEVSIGTEMRNAAFGAQGATEPVTVLLAAGATSYVQVQVDAPPGMVRATLVPVDPADATRDLQEMRLAPP